MPFGLTNAPTTFCTLMNQVFREYLDKFVVVYLDDIMIYSRTLEEHQYHLKLVMQKLRENKLYVKREKCAFAQTSVKFLGHAIEGGKIRMDNEKIAAIQNWAVPRGLTELRSFLGLANYYRKFITGFSCKAVPLTELLKKGHAWEWTTECQTAFESLKASIISNPVLALPDMKRPFVVETDASEMALGGVLSQDHASMHDNIQLRINVRSR